MFPSIFLFLFWIAFSTVSAQVSLLKTRGSVSESWSRPHVGVLVGFCVNCFRFFLVIGEYLRRSYIGVLVGCCVFVPGFF